uniref:CID domain-containing protein n=1 Tax=Strongyloides stercoralis TaxID=6248 RepID=A0A0K0DY17_STRER
MNFEESLNLITKLRQNYQKEDALEYFKTANISVLPLYNTKILLVYVYYLSNFAISMALNPISYLKKKTLWKSIVKLLNNIFDILDKVENYEEKFNILLMICNICSFYKEFDDDLLVELCYEYGYMLKEDIENPQNSNLYSKERKNELLEYFENIEHTFIMRNQKNDENETKSIEKNLNNSMPLKVKTFSFNEIKEDSPLWINRSIDQAIIEKKIHHRRLIRKNTLINVDMFNDPSAPAVQLIKKRVQEIEKDMDDNETIIDKGNHFYNTVDQLKSNSIIKSKDMDIKECVDDIVNHIVTAEKNISSDEDNNNRNDKKSFSLQNFRQMAIDDSSNCSSLHEFNRIELSEPSNSFIETLSETVTSSRSCSSIITSPNTYYY